MLLALTNSEDATASFLLPILESEGVNFRRVDTDSLTAVVRFSYRTGIPEIELEGARLTPDKVTNIWYRRPERLKDGRFDDSVEGRYTLAEWTECVEGFFAHVPASRWLNHPARNALASHKMEQLTTAQTLGFHIPDTLVTQNPDELRLFQKTHDGIITKPMATGYLERGKDERDSLIYTNDVTADDVIELDDLTTCPTLFQARIQKSYDVRITVIDDDVHAVALFAPQNGQQKCDIRRDNMVGVRYQPLELPDPVIGAVRRLMKHYQLRFGAIDMAVSAAGDWYFFEINPNGQWAWLDLCAGTNIAASFVNAFSQKTLRGRLRG